MFSRLVSRNASINASTQIIHRSFSSFPRIFANYTSYGRNIALQFAPQPPIYTQAHTGNYFKLKRGGSFLLTFIRAQENGGFDYENKYYFSLSPTECGRLLNLLESSKYDDNFELTHSTDATDPTQQKVLLVEKKGKEVQFTIEAENLSKTLKSGDARVLQELLSYAIPRLLGFHFTLENSPNVEGGGIGVGIDHSNNQKHNTFEKSKDVGNWPF